MRQSSWTVVSTEFSGAFAARLAPLGLPVQVPGPEKLWTASISSIFFLLWLLGDSYLCRKGVPASLANVLLCIPVQEQAYQHGD